MTLVIATVKDIVGILVTSTGKFLAILNKFVDIAFNQKCITLKTEALDEVNLVIGQSGDLFIASVKGVESHEE